MAKCMARHAFYTMIHTQITLNFFKKNQNKQPGCASYEKKSEFTHKKNIFLSQKREYFRLEWSSRFALLMILNGSLMPSKSCNCCSRTAFAFAFAFASELRLCSSASASASTTVGLWWLSFLRWALALTFPLVSHETHQWWTANEQSPQKMKDFYCMVKKRVQQRTGNMELYLYTFFCTFHLFFLKKKQT